jgi:hypothetical protein
VSPQCGTCARFVKVKGCRHNGQHGYASSFYAIGECSRCGEVPIAWDWLGDVFDPEDPSTWATK